jgi:transcriptional regulator with XRE-family HTH domain
MIDRAFGEVVRRLRAEAGLSQEAVGLASGLHRTYISQLERGLKSASLRTVAVIAPVLNVSLTRLFTLIEAELSSAQQSARLEGRRS